MTGILRGVTKVALIAMAAAFAVGLLCIGLLLAVVSLIRYLLTGRKPTLFATFSRFNRGAQQFRPGAWPGNSANARPDSADIVDVQAHEVRSALGAPTQSKTAD